MVPEPFASDPEGKLWKMWTTVDSWSEEAQNNLEMNKGVSVSRFLGIFVIYVKLCLFG
jgi:hypothetical protein